MDNKTKEEIKRLYENGNSYKAIAEKLNIKTTQVEYVLHWYRDCGVKVERWWKR